MARLLACAALSLFAAGCLLTSGPNCSDACDKVLACKDLKGTFRLSCSTIATGCLDDVATCATCLDNHPCDELVGGACDSVCRLDLDAGH